MRLKSATEKQANEIVIELAAIDERSRSEYFAAIRTAAKEKRPARRFI
jgi:hypothetical protein